jgi:hypothetical protein
MMPVVDLSGHCTATEESSSFYTRGVCQIGHVTDKSLGHVTDESLSLVTDESLGGEWKRSYIYHYICGSCDHLYP